MRTETRTRTQEYHVYITTDGKEFDTPREAKEHEDTLLHERQIPNTHVLFDSLDVDGAYIYKIESEEDLEYLNATVWYHHAYWTYKGPDWYIAIRNDGGDYYDDYNVLSVKHYLSLLESDINKLKKIEVFDF